MTVSTTIFTAADGDSKIFCKDGNGSINMDGWTIIMDGPLTLTGYKHVSLFRAKIKTTSEFDAEALFYVDDDAEVNLNESYIDFSERKNRNQAVALAGEIGSGRLHYPKGLGPHDLDLRGPVMSGESL
jgi:hypothetical protein